MKITIVAISTGLNLDFAGSPNSAPSRIRTCGLLLRRHSRAVARRCQAWPDVLSSCTDSGWPWPGVARCLPVLAPNWLPEVLLPWLMFE